MTAGVGMLCLNSTIELEQIQVRGVSDVKGTGSEKLPKTAWRNQKRCSRIVPYVMKDV